MGDQGALSLVKTVLRSLVVSSPHDMTVEQLQRDYEKEEGRSVPYAMLGYRSFEAFLLSLPDTFQVFGRGRLASVEVVATEKSAHIQSLVRDQKKRPRPQSQARRMNFINLQKNMNSHCPVRQLPQQPPDQIPYPNFSRLQAQIAQDNFRPLGFHYVEPQPQMTLQPQSQGGHSKAPWQRHQNAIRQPAGWAKNAPRAVQGIPKPSWQKKPPKAVQGIPKQSWPEKPPQEFQNILKPAWPQKPPQATKKPKDSQPRDGNGVASNQKKVPPSEEPVMSVTSALQNIKLEEIDSPPEPEIVPVNPFISDQEEVPAKGANPFLEDKPMASSLGEGNITKKELEEAFYDYISSDEGACEDAIPSYAMDRRVLNVDYPPNVVRYEFQLPERDITAYIAVKERIEVLLVNVQNPHNFKFWLYNDDIEQYKLMNENMQFVYGNARPNKYAMPLSLVTTGHLCVVHSNKSDCWERAQVVRHRPGRAKFVEVELIDSGDMMNVCPSELKFLLKQFAVLPSQYYCGSLAFLTPREGLNWSAEAVDYFFKLVSFRRLYAKVEFIRDGTVFMVLVDPDNSGHSKNINRLLIDSGWVRRCCA
ncbi:hypothetical protein KR018_011999 [Drosophila ironensis]|nr:hypothetical protein KR018_011999 [Drosophila ironensis]